MIQNKAFRTGTRVFTIHCLFEESRCLYSGFYQDVDKETAFLVIQDWKTQKDSDDNLRSDIFMVLMGAGMLMCCPPEIVIHTVSHSSDGGLKVKKDDS
jgi:hypothetical protein